MWCPFAVDKRLPEWSTEPRIVPTTLIFHSIVGSLAGADGHFRFHTSIEAHFGVGHGPMVGSADVLDPEVWQWQTTTRQADANRYANDFAVSVETSDQGDPDDQPWTDPQLARLVRLGLWVLSAHPTIPRRLATRWDSGGIGYHTMFGAPSMWTPVAKTCPGRVRIEQFYEVLLPALRSGVNPYDQEGGMADKVLMFGMGTPDNPDPDVAEFQEDLLWSAPRLGLSPGWAGGGGGTRMAVDGVYRHTTARAWNQMAGVVGIRVQAHERGRRARDVHVARMRARAEANAAVDRHVAGGHADPQPPPEPTVTS